MMVAESEDAPEVYLARAAPSRWFEDSGTSFGIANVTTWFGRVGFNVTVPAGGTAAGQGSGSSIDFVRFGLLGQGHILG